VTAEDWAPYAVPGTEPDEDGWYPDYLPVPAELLPPEPTEPTGDGEEGQQESEIDRSLLGLVENWRFVVADLIERGVDLWDPAVRARPWPGIRTLIFSLLETDTRLRRALTRR
jgi:hypothetical protein